MSRLPGFGEGRVSVQDAGAQLAAPLLRVRGGMRVLDACAAPGGKTARLVEQAGAGADVTGVDIDPDRAGLTEEGRRRLKRGARAVVADGRDPGRAWDGRPGERYLGDA